MKTDITFIQQYGLQRTGTCYLNWLLNNNFENIRVLAGDKHTRPIDITKIEPQNFDSSHMTHQLTTNMKTQLVKAAESKQLKYVISIKNPYSWIKSWYRYKPNSGSIETVIKTWNKKNNIFLDFYNNNIDNAFIVLYQDLIINYEDILSQIEQKFNLQKTGDLITNIEKRMTRGYTPGNRNFNKNYYINREYMNEFNKKQITKIKTLTDKKLLESLGYEV